MVKSLHTPEYKYFRSLLVNARENAGLTQAEVSAKLQRPQSFVAKYEGGERRLDLIEFIQVCEALGINSNSLLTKMQVKIAK